MIHEGQRLLPLNLYCCCVIFYRYTCNTTNLQSFSLSPQREWLLKATQEKTSSNTIPAPQQRWCHLPYTIVNFFIFEWVLFAVIAVNGACTIAEFIITDVTALQTLEYINYIFVAIYIVEFFLKVCRPMGSMIHI